MPDITAVEYPLYLTDYTIAYENDDFIGTQLFPVKKAASRVGRYFIYGIEGFTSEDDLRAPGTEANEVDHEYTSASFYAEEHSLKEGVPWEVRDEAAALGGILDPYFDATEIVTRKIDLGRERQIASTLRDVTQITHNTTLTGTAQWTDYTNSDPNSNITAGKSAIRGSIFTDQNLVAVVPWAVFEVLRYHPKVLSYLTITNTRILTQELLATIWGVDQVLVPAALYNSANPNQTPNMVDVWGKDVILARVENNPGLRSRTVGLTFRVVYNSRNYQGPQMAEVRQWTEQIKKRDVVEVSYTEARQLTSPGSAYLIKNVIP